MFRTLIGIEIKSDADNYARLERQVRDYDQYFDANYVVVGVSHAMHIEEHVPSWWGIITAEPDGGRVDLYILRKTSPNPKWYRRKNWDFSGVRNSLIFWNRTICRATDRKARLLLWKRFWRRFQGRN